MLTKKMPTKIQKSRFLMETAFILREDIMKYVYVIINSTTQSLDRPFLYQAEDSLCVEVGDCVDVPFGAKKMRTEAFVMSIFDEIPERDLEFKGKLKEVKAIIFKNAFRNDDIETIKFIRNKYLSTFLEAIRLFIPRGTLKGIDFKKRIVIKVAEIPEGKYEKYIGIFNFVRNSNETMTRSDLAKAGFSVSSINTMIKHGFLKLEDEREVRYSKEKFKEYNKPELNQNQILAVKGIESSDKTVTLLHGITGSGKTEVFMELVERAIKRSEDCVILVPEISLTPQMIERFKGRFGDDISIYHSRMSEGERFDEYFRVRDAKVKIAIGARSALFLPFKNLKLVIIDEEHESSYKSESNPKYRTAEVAEFMMSRKGKVILSSATPRLESYFRSENNEINREELKERATNSELPVIEVVDMREELLYGNRGILSRKLINLMEEKLSRKEQIILFLNRRGFSNFVSCRKCGFVYKCKDCSVSLTLHNDGRLVCHHCGYQERMTGTCPSCKSKMIKKFGIGTEQVEKAVKELFKEARVLRMDKDTTSAKNSYSDIYNKFKNGEADILIGTQMVAKGLDFPDVTLVGILSADMSLNIPDFRSYEKTFSLITQVSGRAGRGKSKGIVVLQGYDIDNYAIKKAVENDYRGFYDEEIKMRKLLDYPPCDNIFAMVLSGENELETLKSAQVISDILRNNLKKYNIIVLGPTASLISKLKSLYRYQILLKGKIDTGLGLAIKNMVYNELKGKNIRISLDTDPEYLL